MKNNAQKRADGLNDIFLLNTKLEWTHFKTKLLIWRKEICVCSKFVQWNWVFHIKIATVYKHFALQSTVNPNQLKQYKVTLLTYRKDFLFCDFWRQLLRKFINWCAIYCCAIYCCAIYCCVINWCAIHCCAINLCAIYCSHLIGYCCVSGDKISFVHMCM